MQTKQMKDLEYLESQFEEKVLIKKRETADMAYNFERYLKAKK